MHEASESRVGLLLFPEAVLTGLNICDDYSIDRGMACPLDSSPIRKIISHAKKYHIWTAFGFLELSGNTIYGSALLVDENGRIVLYQEGLAAADIKRA